MQRRDFLTRAAATAVLPLQSATMAAQTSGKPNILWITCEDMGPHLGAYGDSYATSPTLDALATGSLRYDNAWSNAPVCAPARTTIISGMYPPCTGSEHMRSMTRLPDNMKMFPWYLREAGYYTSNNAKEDYNLEHTGKVWDESSNKAHWRNRAQGQPFFAVFNFTITHESQIRRRPHKLVHDPAKAPIPAYHPDTPEVRHDWAQYYDNITTMDGQAAAVLAQLKEDGLAENTIVFFYGDHGSGMPRSKRWPYNSGLRVPLLVHFPEKFRNLAPKDYAPGKSTSRLVSFVDLAPTVLSLAGIKVPPHLQGRAFAGPAMPSAPPTHIHGFRGRMDERYDCVRSVRDERYVYIRNYMPHKIYGQYLDYMFQTPTTRVWRDLYLAGKLDKPKTFFWETKPPEELYDLQTDPHEVNNLAGSPQHRDVLERLRKAQREHAARIRDVGFLPENEIHGRAAGSTPYEMGHDPKRYPFDRVFAAADLASGLKQEDTPRLLKMLSDNDSAVRYWAVLGLLMRGKETVAGNREALRKALADTAPSVRIAAGEALGRYDETTPAQEILDVLLPLADAERNGVHTAMLALNAIDAMGVRSKTAVGAVAKLPAKDPRADARMGSYVGRLIKDFVADRS
jgi:uncharacterized sulfatase